MQILKVSSKSEPKSVAGAIAAILRSGDEAEIIAVGAAAVNQVVKSICVARGYVVSNGFDIVAIPSFISVVIDDKEKTAIRFIAQKKM